MGGGIRDNNLRKIHARTGGPSFQYIYPLTENSVCSKVWFYGGGSGCCCCYPCWTRSLTMCTCVYTAWIFSQMLKLFIVFCICFPSLPSRFDALSVQINPLNENSLVRSNVVTDARSCMLRRDTSGEGNCCVPLKAFP